ncbi:MAG: PUR family DNA/RNA-binding protein [Alistipes sp.]|nr:PUR family DNA/RNA-binding protein [Alistipes sp.]MDE7129161.1 PUR family DNA/RNA-binding protein [Alistipes sp.]
MMSDQMNRREADEYGEQIYTKAVRAGKRTYFFDVKATRNDDYYLTVTESRKKINSDGTAVYSRHKIYLYKEDFKKFMGGLSEMIDYIKEHKPEFFEQDDAECEDIDEAFDRL